MQETSVEAEEKALKKFQEVYLREAVREDKNDDAAIMLIAYGLRPAIRNLESELKAIEIFKNIFKTNPNSSIDWDVVRAIAYSGATR